MKGSWIDPQKLNPVVILTPIDKDKIPKALQVRGRKYLEHSQSRNPKPLASYQTKSFIIPVPIPENCPKWFSSHKRLFIDLKYFQAHLKIREHRLAVLDGSGPCYNRLIIALSKIDDLVNNGQLSRKHTQDLTGWLHSSIESYPAQPHQISRVLNHFNNSWKVPAEDRKYFTNDRENKQRQIEYGEFAPPWMHQTLNGITAAEATLQYWNIRNDNADSSAEPMTAARLRELKPELHAWLLQFRENQVDCTEHFNDEQLAVIKQRLEYADRHINNLSGIQSFSWHDIGHEEDESGTVSPEPTAFEVSGRKKKGKPVDSPQPPLAEPKVPPELMKTIRPDRERKRKKFFDETQPDLPPRKQARDRVDHYQTIQPGNESNTFIRHRKMGKPYTFSPIDNILDWDNQQAEKPVAPQPTGVSLKNLHQSLNRLAEIAGMASTTTLSDETIIESVEAFTGQLLSNATWQTLVDSPDAPRIEALEDCLVLIAYLQDQIAALREKEKSPKARIHWVSLHAGDELSQLKSGVEFIRNALRQKKAIHRLKQTIDDLKESIAILEQDNGDKKEANQLRTRLKTLSTTLLGYDKHLPVKDATDFGHWLSPPHSFPATLKYTRQCLSTNGTPEPFDYADYQARRNQKLASVQEKVTELINKTPDKKEDKPQWKASFLTLLMQLNEQISLELVTSLKPFEHNNEQAREEIKAIRGIQYLLMECCAALKKQPYKVNAQELFEAIKTLMAKE